MGKLAFTPAEVKRIRDELQMTQKEMAAALNVDLRTIQKWEGGERRVRGGVAAAYKMLVEIKARNRR